MVNAKKTILFIGGLLSFCFLQAPLIAGGPLEVRKGKALSLSKTIVYKFDQGNLGNLSNDEAIELVDEVLKQWEGVKTASIKFKKGNPAVINTDIDSSNFRKFLSPKTDKDLLGFTLIIFDDDGSLLDAYIGSGASKTILGVGAPIVLKFGQRFSLPEARIVLNGKLINGIEAPGDKEVSVDVYKGGVLHEVGHAIGLDHSQLNVEALEPDATQEVKDATPLMFPIGKSSMLEIMLDDISAISYLYPNKTELINFGTIKGRVLREDGKTPVLGANVVLRNINNSLVNSISCVSDFLANMTGTFIFTAVPPGSYTVEIEPIDSMFVSGSTAGPKVGPYTKNTNDKSFENPVSKGFYAGLNMSTSEDKNNAEILQVNPQETISGIDIISTAD